MWKLRRFRTTMGGKRSGIKEEYLNKFLVRQPVGKLDRLNPNAKRVYNRMIQEPEPLTYKLQEIPQREADYNWEISKPLGNTEMLPFKIMRTHTNNLPVYSDYKNNRIIRETIVRNISGDVEEFKKELSKIVSNAEIKHKVGKVIVTGMHSLKIKLWLRRLGF